jgi:hypothetical protein
MLSFVATVGPDQSVALYGHMRLETIFCHGSSE